LASHIARCSRRCGREGEDEWLPVQRLPAAAPLKSSRPGPEQPLRFARAEVNASTKPDAPPYASLGDACLQICVKPVAVRSA
jgi:hypothetical protein